MPPKPRGDLPFLTSRPSRNLLADAAEFYADHMHKVGEEKDIRRLVEPSVDLLRETGEDLRKYIAE